MSDLPFLLYPPDPTATSPTPLIVFLHGSGERGTDLELVKRYGAPAFLERGSVLPAFLLAPQCPAGASWAEIIAELEHLLSRVVQDNGIAPNRISLTGFSMGGFGAWGWIAAHPERFSAMAAVAGSGVASEFADAVASDLSHPCRTRLRMEHGAVDDIVPLADAEAWFAQLEAQGHRCIFVRHAELGHAAVCERVYGDQSHYRWLLGQDASA